MNFLPRFDKQSTPQKVKNSDGSPSSKRIRLASPSPINNVSTQSKNVQHLTSLNNVETSISITPDDDVYPFIILNFNLYKDGISCSTNTTEVKHRKGRSTLKLNRKEK
jgi:hypothetical protein